MAITEKQRDIVLRTLEQGESLRKACRDADIARPSDVLDCANPEKPQYIKGFDVHYARARETGYLLLADEIIEISDANSGDTYTDDKGRERTDQEVVSRARLRVDSRKWVLAKMLPKVYGEKSDVNLTGKLEHAHTGQVSDATAGILAQIGAGSSKSSDEGALPD